jgi:hypothetical protein
VYLLADAFPVLRRWPVSLGRDRLFLLMAALNEYMLAVEIWLAHSISGTIRPDEWIPIVFGPIAGTLLAAAGLVDLRNRGLAVGLAVPVYLASIGVGLLGAWFHVYRAVLPWAPAGERVSLGLLVWGPPVIAPLTFALVGMFGLSALWPEDPPDSGVLALPGGARVRLPFSKTRAYLFWVSLGMLATLVSSVLDHAHTDFSDGWLWVPTTAGIAGTVVPLLMGFQERPTRTDVRVYVACMVLIILVGVVGIFLHARSNLVVQGAVVGERFIHGAPLLAPMLFADMATFGLLVLLDSNEARRRAAHGGQDRSPENDTRSK